MRQRTQVSKTPAAQSRASTGLVSVSVTWRAENRRPLHLHLLPLLLLLFSAASGPVRALSTGTGRFGLHIRVSGSWSGSCCSQSAVPLLPHEDRACPGFVSTHSHRASSAVWFGSARSSWTQRSFSSRQGTHMFLRRLSSQKLPTSCSAWWHWSGCTEEFCRNTLSVSFRSKSKLLRRQCTRPARTYRDQDAVQVPRLAAVAISVRGLVLQQLLQPPHAGQPQDVDVVVAAESLQEREVDLQRDVVLVLLVGGEDAQNHAVRVSVGGWEEVSACPRQRCVLLETTEAVLTHSWAWRTRRLPPWGSPAAAPPPTAPPESDSPSPSCTDTSALRNVAPKTATKTITSTNALTLHQTLKRAQKRELFCTRPWKDRLLQPASA